jgi:hypothetical protein
MANTLKFGNGEWYGKKDTILAYNDENDNYKPLPFDFSRGSSATVINKDGLIETVSSGQPRIDYKDDTKGALLLEPQRTNRMTTSEPTSGGNGFVYNQRTWDNGLSNGLTATDATGGATKYYYMVTGIANEYSTFSFYIEMADGSEPIIGSSSDVNADLSVMVKNYFLSESQVIKTNTINNIWKIEGISLPQSLSGTGQIGVLKYSAHSNKTFYATGFQIEQGSYATSYIPTSGSAVTRVGDLCINSGNNQVFESSKGVLYLNTSTLVSTQTSDNSIILTDGVNNKLLFRYRSTNVINLKVFVNGAAQTEENYTLSDATDFNKIAIKWELNNYKIYVNGVNVFTSDNALVFPNDSIKNLSFADGTSTPFYGNVKDAKIYNTALTDQELQALTQ